MSADPLVRAPFGADPIPLLARRLLARHAAELPDLSRHVVLLPQAELAGRFRRQLLAAAEEAGAGALLPPWIGTLPAWLSSREPPTPALTPAARELLLLQALASFPELLQRFGTWSLLDALLPLFDELTAHARALPDGQPELIAVLCQGYGVGESLPALEQEAHWVLTLWNAWRQNLADHGWRDGSESYRAALGRSLERLPATTQIYVAADLEQTVAERQWLRALKDRGQLTLLLQGAPLDPANSTEAEQPYAALLTDLGYSPAGDAPGDALAELLRAVYHGEGIELAARAQQFAARHARSPAADRLAVFAAADLEQEARAVELQVRRWLLAGAVDIAIITADRKLARRVRALLERAGIALRDPGGWALSTTSAAAAIDRWLECLQQDFAPAALLDFLKSPFVRLAQTTEQHERLVRRLETELIRRHRLTGHGLAPYRRLLRRFAADATDTDGEALATLFTTLEQAAAPLTTRHAARRQHAIDFCQALDESLRHLGLPSALAQDPAGREVAAALSAMKTAATVAGRLSFAAFRHWLERELERRRFRPTISGASVTLMTTAESRYFHFDAVILAGCTRDHLPGRPTVSPFFNDGVRRRLGLPSRRQRGTWALHDFQRLLQAAPKVLLTHRRNDGREPVVPSPWLEQLQMFHRLAYGPLADDGLATLVTTLDTLLTEREATALPTPATPPLPPVPRERLPAVWSAGTYQRLLDCPYQMLAADIFGLQPQDEIPAEIEAADYGERVHRVLQAFHHGAPGLPGPWRDALTAATRPAAERLLHEITDAVFARDLAHRFSSRGWLYRWQATIPAYLDWLQDHLATGAQPEASEQRLEHTIYIDGHAVVLRGRIDRIDLGPTGKIVIDYKTGRVPDRHALAAGEQGQLPFYSMLLQEPVEAALYLGLQEAAARAAVGVSGGELVQLQQWVRQRIEAAVRALSRGAGLPAHGDADCCRLCAYEILCRRGLWDGPARN